MAGGGGGIESHNEFSLIGWAESRGGEVESLTWSIEGDPESDKIPVHLQKYAPILMQFDAEKKTLYINLGFCEAFGVAVEAIPDGAE